MNIEIFVCAQILSKDNVVYNTDRQHWYAASDNVKKPYNSVQFLDSQCGKHFDTVM